MRFAEVVAACHLLSTRREKPRSLALNLRAAHSSGSAPLPCKRAAASRCSSVALPVLEGVTHERLLRCGSTAHLFPQSYPRSLTKAAKDRCASEQASLAPPRLYHIIESLGHPESDGSAAAPLTEAAVGRQLAELTAALHRAEASHRWGPLGACSERTQRVEAQLPQSSRCKREAPPHQRGGGS